MTNSATLPTWTRVNVTTKGSVESGPRTNTFTLIKPYTPGDDIIHVQGNQGWNFKIKATRVLNLEVAR